MTTRELVCACEDVTRSEIEAALQNGYRDMESLKRYTGLGTGLCQGRSCMTALARILHAHGERALAPTTARAPLWPVTLGSLATSGELPPLYPSAERPAQLPAPPLPSSPTELPPLPEAADIVIIGGGILGLATAYHLAALGHSRIVVLERGYLNAGASGRNGGGIRAQWSTARNVTLMQESIARCRRFAKDFGVNVWMRQGGYLFLATTEAQLAALEQNVALQNRLGVRTRLLTAEQAKRIAPEVTTSDVQGASYNPEDGVIFPWPFLWGYAAAARRLGVHIATFTAATGIETTAGKVSAVITPRGRIRCGLVINAAAAWAGEVASLVGVRLPNRPQRHEILVTESFKPFLDPLVIELGSSLYLSQSMRGEIVSGLGDSSEPPGIELRSSLRFAVRIARALVHRLPRLAQVRVVRQWAGCYDVTPDHHPVIGEVPEVGGFYQLHGFVGHGFMMAPAVSRIVAEHIVHGTPHEFVTHNGIARFQSGVPEPETMVIG